jgi:hypothetical protein
MKLDNREWKEFFIGGKDGIFEITSSSSGIDKNKLLPNTNKANIPYITRSEENNGINLFIQEKQSNKYNLDEENVITIGLDTQTVFYQSHKFYTGQNIQVLRYKKLNKLNAEFLIPLIKVQMQKFNWGGNGATLGRLYKTKIMLPVNQKDNIDWQFMEQYTKSSMDKKLNSYKKYAQSVLEKLWYKEIEKLEDKEWKEFSIEDIMNVKSGKRLTKADMINGNKPFIGSSDSNNGITEFISNINQSEDSNILGVNYNGSVVENFYHPYKAIFSDDVKRLSLKNIEGNKYLYLFIKNLILKQKNKYQYAYKFNEKRLKRQKILLPINDIKEPDYEYMEQYIINMKYKKIKQYLDYLERKYPHECADRSD